MSWGFTLHRIFPLESNGVRSRLLCRMASCLECDARLAHAIDERDERDQRHYRHRGNAANSAAVVRSGDLDGDDCDFDRDDQCCSAVSRHPTHAQHVSQGVTSIAGLAKPIAECGVFDRGVCFIFSLGGLSRHETARRGNLLGILGIRLRLQRPCFRY